MCHGIIWPTLEVSRIVGMLRWPTHGLQITRNLPKSMIIYCRILNIGPNVSVILKLKNILNQVKNAIKASKKSNL